MNEQEVSALYERVARAEEAVTKLGEQVEQLEKELGAVPHWLRQRAAGHQAIGGVGPSWAAALFEAAEDLEQGKHRELVSSKETSE
jgi:hypothetical protein